MGRENGLTMKTTLLTCAATLLMLCGCYTQQQQSAIMTEEWAAQLNKDFQSRLRRTVREAADISLAQNTRHLPPGEQETLKMLLLRPGTVENAGIGPHKVNGVRIICKDAQGESLFDEEVRIVPHSQVSEEGYAHHTVLELPDEYYAIWQSIVEGKKPVPSQKTHAAAKAEHQQAVDTMRQLLKTCKMIDIRGHSNVYKSAYQRNLTEAETRELRAILGRAKPLPVAGCVKELREREMFIYFCDDLGRTIGRLPAADITDAASARDAERCADNENMYLSAPDYKRLQELLEC